MFNSLFGGTYIVNKRKLYIRNEYTASCEVSVFKSGSSSEVSVCDASVSFSKAFDYIEPYFMDMVGATVGWTV